MPTYSYHCQQCGAFAAVRRMAEFDQPAACPVCFSLSGRTLTMPALLGSRASAKAPAQSNAGEPPSDYKRWGHASGCACC